MMEIDLSSYPILRLDQISLIDSGTLRKADNDINELILNLQSEDDNSQRKFIEYLEKQLQAMRKELTQRSAEDRIRALLEGSCETSLFKTDTSYTIPSPRNHPKSKKSADNRDTTSNSPLTERDLLISKSATVLETTRRMDEEKSPHLQSSATFSNHSRPVLSSVAQTHRKVAVEPVFKAVPLPSELNSASAIKQNSPVVATSLRRNSCGAVDSESSGGDGDGDGEGYGGPSHLVMSSRSDELKTEQAQAKARRPSSGSGTRRLAAITQNFGTAFVVAGTEKKKRHISKKVPVESDAELREKERLGRRKAAMARLMERRQQREKRQEVLRRKMLLQQEQNLKSKVSATPKADKHIHKDPNEMPSSESESISGGDDVDGSIADESDSETLGFPTTTGIVIVGVPGDGNLDLEEGKPSGTISETNFMKNVGNVSKDVSNEYSKADNIMEARGQGKPSPRLSIEGHSGTVQSSTITSSFFVANDKEVAIMRSEETPTGNGRIGDKAISGVISREETLSVPAVVRSSTPRDVAHDVGDTEAVARCFALRDEPIEGTTETEETTHHHQSNRGSRSARFGDVWSAVESGFVSDSASADNHSGEFGRECDDVQEQEQERVKTRASLDVEPRSSLRKPSVVANSTARDDDGADDCISSMLGSDLGLGSRIPTAGIVRVDDTNDAIDTPTNAPLCSSKISSVHESSVRGIICSKPSEERRGQSESALLEVNGTGTSTGDESDNVDRKELSVEQNVHLAFGGLDDCYDDDDDEAIDPDGYFSMSVDMDECAAEDVTDNTDGDSKTTTGVRFPRRDRGKETGISSAVKFPSHKKTNNKMKKKVQSSSNATTFSEKNYRLSSFYEHIGMIFPVCYSNLGPKQTETLGSKIQVLLECMQLQTRHYEEWQQVMADYATVFSADCAFGDMDRALEVEEYEGNKSASVYSGSSKALHYRVKSTRTEVCNIVTDVFRQYLKDWEELPAGLGLGMSWNLLWSWGKPRINWTQLLVWQRVNHFEDSRELTRKDYLKKNLQRYTVMGGRAAAAFEIMPLTYLLPHEYTVFVRAFLDAAGQVSSASGNTDRKLSSEGDGRTVKERAGVGDNGQGESSKENFNLWIMKPVGLSRGRGISLVNDISQVTYSQATVIQKYVERPLCLAGFKFDLRLYVLVTSFRPLEAFIYKEGFARLSTQAYSLSADNIANKFIHLTNSSIQKMNPDGPAVDCPLMVESEDIGGSKISLLGNHGLWSRLRQCGMNPMMLWSRISSLVVKSLVVVDDRISYQPCAFEVFGYDVLIDSDLRPWLLEVNASPSLARENALDIRVKNSMIRDTMLLLNPAPFDRAAVARVLERRLKDLSQNKAFIAKNDPTLENDLRSILGDYRPRLHGEEPEYLGEYERLCPNTKIYESVLKLKKMIIKQ